MLHISSHCRSLTLRKGMATRNAGVNADLASVESRSIKRICVFGGASSGSRPEYLKSAESLGKELVRRKIGVVYGGGTVGVMGEVARTVLNGLGNDSVIGVIPEALKPREVSGPMIGDTRVVETMHQRKEMMANEADAFIVLPGGFGTLEEMMEIVTWQQLGFHTKPIGVLNIEGFFTKLMHYFDHLRDEGFVRKASRDIILSSDDPATLVNMLEKYKAPESTVELARNGSLDPSTRG